MPRQEPARDPERHRDRDRGERHHGALPLAEDREVEERAADQRREPRAAGVERRGAPRRSPRRTRGAAAGSAPPPSPGRAGARWRRAPWPPRAAARAAPRCQRVRSRKVKRPKLASFTSQSIAGGDPAGERELQAARHLLPDAVERAARQVARSRSSRRGDRARRRGRSSRPPPPAAPTRRRYSPACSRTAPAVMTAKPGFAACGPAACSSSTCHDLARPTRPIGVPSSITA